MKKRLRHFGKKLLLCAAVLCVPGIILLGGLGRMQKEHAPSQDEDGYYLLCTKDDFRWFTTTVNDGNWDINVRLGGDLILNDTDRWEEWADTSPGNGYAPVTYYNGHFDGNGYALEGYNARNGKWLASIFTILEEDARITDLEIRNSVFYTTLEDSGYEDSDEETDVVIAAVLCHTNYGLIENCDVQGKVVGAWKAGGIAGINYGEMINCRFTGTLEAGTDQSTEPLENLLAVSNLYAGGICCSNYGRIRGCINEGTVTLKTLSDAFPMEAYAAGGITGRLGQDGSIENSQNMGKVTSVQLVGGIAGASWGTISQCTNSGKVFVGQVDREYAEALISAGICASNGGVVDTCLNTGEVGVEQKYLSFYAPIYGIACNTVNPSDGVTKNSYYLKESVSQDYRQSGVYKLSLADTPDFPAYLSGEKRIEDVDTWELLTELPGYAGTDEEDYIHLEFGPSEDVRYEVVSGDNLWSIAEKFYGDGTLYGLLERSETVLTQGLLLPGEEILIPHKDYYLLCPNDEEGFTWSYCMLPSGEICPTSFVAAKPVDWYYGNMHFDANFGVDTLWPKDLEKGHDAPAADIRIFYRLDTNPEGDFWGSDWEAAKERIRKNALSTCGGAIGGLQFYRYMLDNGESLYGLSFLLYKQGGAVKCAAFYRLCDNMAAEFIGVEPVEEEEHVLERVRYLAARVDTACQIEEVQYDPEEFYGRENWDFPQIHNPFAIALAYSKDAECDSYMLFTGAQ